MVLMSLTCLLKLLWGSSHEFGVVQHYQSCEGVSDAQDEGGERVECCWYAQYSVCYCYRRVRMERYLGQWPPGRKRYPGTPAAGTK